MNYNTNHTNTVPSSITGPIFPPTTISTSVCDNRSRSSNFLDDEATTKLIADMETLARLNNMAITQMESNDATCTISGSDELSKADHNLKMALLKANEMKTTCTMKMNHPSVLCQPRPLFPFSGIMNTSSTPSCSARMITTAGFHSDSDQQAGASRNSSTSLYIYQRGEYDEGMTAHMKPVSINPAVSSVESVSATISFNLGILSIRMNQDDNAKNYLLLALELVRKTQIQLLRCGDAHHRLNHIPILCNLGFVKYRNGHYEDALRMFDEALQLQRSNCMTSHEVLETSTILNCMGVLYFHLPEGNADRALELYHESLSIRLAVLGFDVETKEIATTLNNIGRVHYMMGQNEEALEMYNRALAMRRRLLGWHHIDVAATAYNAGQTYHKRGQLDKAMVLYEQFLVIARDHFGDSHRDVAIMLKCVAQIHHEKKQYARAAMVYEQAIAAAKGALGYYHPEVACVLNKYGNMLYESGDLDGAVRVYTEGLEVERAVFDYTHPNIVVTLTNIGQIHKVRGNYCAALRLHKEAAQMQKKVLGISHPGLSKTVSSIGLIHYQSGNYPKALNAYQEALRIRRDAYGDNHLDVASTINSIGLVLFKMGLHDYALQSFRESLRIRFDLLGPDHHDVAVVLYNVATIYMEIGDEDEAMKYYRETLRAEKAALGGYHKEVVLTMLRIAHIHQQRGEVDDALQYYTESLQIQKHTICKHAAPLKQEETENQQNYEDMAQTLNHIGNIYLQKAQTKQMMDAFSQSIRHFRSAGKDDKELVISGFNFYCVSKQHPECAPVA